MAISPMAARHPGSAMAARAPATMRGTMPRPRRRSRPAWAACTMASATTTAANDAALMPKTSRVVVGQQDQSGQGRPDDPAQVELGRRQRHRPEQILGGTRSGTMAW